MADRKIYANCKFAGIRRNCREDNWYYSHRGIPETVVQAAEELVELMGKDGPRIIDPHDGSVEMEWGAHPMRCMEVCVSEEEGKIEFLVYDYATEDADPDEDPPKFGTAEAVYQEYGSRLAEAKKRK